MIRRSENHHIAGAFVFLLLGTFALFATLMVAFSAQIYRETVKETVQHNATRVLYNYLANTVHANDAAGGIAVREADGQPLLALSWHDESGEVLYETLIYWREGKLFEQLADPNDPFDAALGEEICPAPCFEPSLQGGLLTVRVSEDAQAPVCIALHSGEVQP